MAKTKEITIGEQKFTLQSVSPSWYYDFNDECGNTGNGKRKSAKYMDGMFKNCVVAPPEVKAKGKGFWCMVWSGNGVTYTELRQMDLAEYQECRQAKRLWVEQWRDEAKPK